MDTFLQIHIIGLLIGVFSIPCGIYGYNTGPPEGACTHFIPGHPPSLGGASPYTITLSHSNYSADDTVTVSIAASSGEYFKGFLIKARREDTSLSQDAVGSFAVIAGTQQLCSAAALCHTNNAEKNNLDLTWTAPSTTVGNLVFQATIVKAQNTYWLEQTSSTLQDPTAVTATTISGVSGGTTVPTATVTIDLSSCGSTKGCYRNPASCTGNDCDAAATWSLPLSDSTHVQFEIIGMLSGNGWIGLGFSSDKSMGDDNVYACVHFNADTNVQNTYNTGKVNGGLTDTMLGITDVESSYENGVLKCRFKRDITIVVTRRKRATDSEKVVDLDQPMHLLLGYGPTNYPGVSFHATATPLPSSDKVTVTTDFVDVGSTDTTISGVSGGTTVPTATVTIDLSSCGSTKGCYRNPASCTGNDCDAAATWSLPLSDSTHVQFEIIGMLSGNGWIGLGFSSDKTMGDDNVYACVHFNADTNVQNTYNTGKVNGALTDTMLGITDVESSYENGVLKCRFKRDITIVVTRRKRATDSEKVVDLDQPMHLLLGYGPTNYQGVSFHSTATPLPSSDKVTVTTDFVDVGSSFTLYRVHGITMLLGWMCFISISLIIARFYKPAWPNTKLAGKDLWFPIHVSLNSLTVLLTIASFIIIFVAVEGYSEFSDATSNFQKAHPPIGIAVTILAILNPIMAIFRCAPDSPNRRIFNVFHWMVGSAAHVLATINIFFGLKMSKAKNFVGDWVWYVMLAFAGFHLITNIVLEIHKCVAKDKGGQNHDDMPGESKPENMNLVINDENEEVKDGLRFKYIVLTVYVIGNVAFFAIMVVGMVLQK